MQEYSGHSRKSLNPSENIALPSLYENLPIPIWEENFSELKIYLNSIGLYGKEVSFIEKCLVENPHIIQESVKKVQIISVNQACLTLHNATDKKSLLEGLGPLLVEESYDAIKAQIIAIATGKTRIEKESVVRTLDGHLRHIHLIWIVVPGHEIDLSRILLTTEDISSRKKAEATLINLSNAVNASGDIVFMTDKAGIITSINSEFSALYGYTPKEIIGKVTPRILKSGVHSLEVYKNFWNNIAKGDLFRGTIVNRKKDGQFVTIEETVSPFWDDNGKIVGYFAIQRDITIRQLIEENMQKERLFSNAIINSMPGIFYMFDVHGKFLRWNNNFEKISGYSSSEIAHMHPTEFFQGSEKDLIRERIGLVFEEGYANAEANFISNDGSRTPHFFTGVKIEIDGQHCLLGVGVDISERKRAEEKLESAMNMLQSALTQSPSGIIIANAPDITIQWVNDAALYIRGNSELPLQNIEMSKHSVSWQTFQLDGSPMPPENLPLSRAILRGEIIRNEEIIIRHATGVDRYVTANAAPIRNSENEITAGIVVFHDITEIKQSQKKLERLAHFDEITDLPNRMFFKKCAGQAIAKSYSNAKKFAIILFDLDGFKNINDSLGHTIGDQLLRIVAQRFNHGLNELDILSRLGGDEFAILVSNLNSGVEAIQTVFDILEISQQPLIVDGHSVMVTSSVGISIYPDDALECDNLIRNADAAMYEAKAGGKNTYRFYRPEMTQKAQNRLALEQEIRHAIEFKEFEVWYQPQINLTDKQYLGAEALIRWRHHERGIVSPMEFIPLAEQTGMILPIQEFVINKVCSDFNEWQKMKLEPGKIAINIAAPQFHRSDLPSILSESMIKHHIPGGKLEIEITESFMMENPREVKEMLSKIQELGITIAIDDFGTGYSSLSYLQELPIDTLKIDKAFIKDVPKNEKDTAIVRAILAMGKSMGYNIVAEGIETIEQNDFLREEGCFEGQGFFYAKPLPKAEFTSWLQNQ